MTVDPTALAVGIDVGGTKIAAGVVDADGRIVARLEVPTPTSDRHELLAAIVDAARRLAATHQVTAVGIGVAGLVDPAGELVRSASHLPLRDEPLRDTVAAATGLTIVVDNDANAAGWAEARFGAARDINSSAFVGVGTGIGGALVVGGRLYRGWQGAAGEIGHMIVERDGRPCPCGSHGCWEQYGSGKALMRLAAEAGYDVPHGSYITAAAVEGDVRAQEILAEIGGWLGIGIASLVAVLDPAVVVVGGGVSDANDLLLTPTRVSFQANMTARGKRPEPELVLAELGPDAGLIGAADLARIGR